MSSRYRPTGVEPVARPRTVGRPAELFCRIRLSITSATCREANVLLVKTRVGVRVCGTYRDDMTRSSRAWGSGAPFVGVLWLRGCDGNSAPAAGAVALQFAAAISYDGASPSDRGGSP